MRQRLSIKSCYFDEIRRGQKKTEYRPMTLFYLQRFQEKFITEVELYNTGMADRLICRVNEILEAPIPEYLLEVWRKIYPDDDGSLVFHLELSHPHYFIDPINKRNLPTMFRA